MKNSWNFDSFPNFNILKICYFSKLNNLRNFWNFPNWQFLKLYKWEILWVPQTGNFYNFTNSNVLKFFKLEIFGIFKIGIFSNIQNWKINKFQDFLNLENQNLVLKIGSFGIVHPFDIPHYSQFCQFSYLLYDIHEFFQFLFPL